MPLKHGEMLDPEDPYVSSGAQGEIFLDWEKENLLAMEYCQVEFNANLLDCDQFTLERASEKGHCSIRIFMETLEKNETYDEALVRGILIDELGVVDLKKMSPCKKLTTGEGDYPLFPHVFMRDDQNMPAGFKHKRIIDAYRLPENFELSWLRQELKLDGDEKIDPNKRMEILGVPFFLPIGEIGKLFRHHRHAVIEILANMKKNDQARKAA